MAVVPVISEPSAVVGVGRAGCGVGRRRGSSLRGGRDGGGGVARRFAVGGAWRAGGGDGALGIGQVDAAAHPRRPGPADFG